MDFNSLKVLHIINKSSKEKDVKLILSESELPEDDFYEIMYSLEQEKYIKFPVGGYAESTNKGKTYFSKLIINWLINNVLAIIAIIISIIALFN